MDRTTSLGTQYPQQLGNWEFVNLLLEPINWNEKTLSEALNRLHNDMEFVDLVYDEFPDHGKRLQAKIENMLSEPEKEELEYTERGTVKQTFANICTIMRNDYSEYLSFNVMDGRAMIKGVPWEIGVHPVRDNDLNHIREEISRTYGIGNERDIVAAVNLTAHGNMVHPIKDLLDGLKWDGVPRIAELFPKYLGAERSEYTTEVTRLLLSGALARIYDPGCKYDYCVVLADTTQGTGKSTVCRLLALKDEWFCDALGDLSNTKTAFEAIRGKWVVEMSEMIATRRTKDIETIKGYISRKSDFYREPYAKCSEDYPRRCVFVGTTNSPAFLPDDRTGNRRFLPILCDGDRAEVHPMADERETRAFILQCYAEVIQTSRGVYSLTLPHRFDAELNSLQEQSAPEDTLAGVIQEWLDHTKEDIVCIQMIWDEVVCGDFKRKPKKHESAEINEIMTLKIKGWKRYAGKNGNAKSNIYRFPIYGSQRAWQREEICNQVCNTTCNQVCNNDGFVPIEETEYIQEPVFD